MTDTDFWMDCTKVGSGYEEQYQPSTRDRRYRPIRLSMMDNDRFDGSERGYGEWTYGKTPR